MLKKYDSTVYFVEDIHNAAQWYADIVGAGVTGDLKIGFHPEGKKSSSGTAGQTTYWRVGSLGASIDVLTGKGAKLYRGPIQTSLDEHACILMA